jgi:hypothetical protein
VRNGQGRRGEWRWVALYGGLQSTSRKTTKNRQILCVTHHEYFVQLVDLRVPREESSLVGHLYGVREGGRKGTGREDGGEKRVDGEGR